MCVLKCVRFVIGKMAKMTPTYLRPKGDEVYIRILNDEG